MKIPFLNVLLEVLNLGRQPLIRAQDQVKLAANKHARAVGEVRYQEKMVSFYQNQSSTLDPYTHWWEFAAAKESERAHKIQLEEEIGFEKHLRNKLEACQERLRSLRYETTP